jgi:hypothetical protein
MEFPKMATAAFTLSMPQKEAFDYTLKALQDAGALIGTQIPPERIEFALKQHDRMAGSLEIPLTGHVLTAKLKDGQTSATLTAGPSMQYVIYVVAIAAIAIVVGNLLLGSLAGIWSALVAVAAAYAMWVLFARLPEDALNALGEKLRSSDKVVGGGPAAPQDAINPEPKPTPKPQPASATTAPKPDASKPLVTPAPQPQKALPAPHDTVERPAA